MTKFSQEELEALGEKEERKQAKSNARRKATAVILNKYRTEYDELLQKFTDEYLS